MTVYDQVVYMTGAMHLYAFKEGGCGHAVCQPLWSGNLLYPYTQQPAVANGVIYATATDGNGNHGAFFAFPVNGCKTICQPLWQGTLDAAYSFPTIANGVVYMGTVNRGKLVAYPAECHKAACAPLWTHTLPGGTPYFQPIVTTPTIMDGIVYLTTTYLVLCAFHL
jgi:outer membrane protein assembly factor BamB